MLDNLGREFYTFLNLRKNMKDQELTILIEQLNTIEHLHQDLMSIAVDYAGTYLRYESTHQALLESLWEQPTFLHQAATSVREAVILGTHCLTLSEEIPFDLLIKEFVDINLQSTNIGELNLNPVQNKAIIQFFNSLRREVFSRIYNQNKELKKVTELKKSLLQERYQQFINFFSEQ